ncbi:DUF6296 family protein [Streptomyces sp. NPDC053429]|uniref:DUF6296 family protein n=1 Tax=unclassified Streptomyces TaxID=2593676 RepID=UPI0033C1D527
MSAERYELVLPGEPGAEPDTVVVSRTQLTGPGGHPVYEDRTGIVRAEISDRGEIRMLPSGGHQDPVTALEARPLQ